VLFISGVAVLIRGVLVAFFQPLETFFDNSATQTATFVSSGVLSFTMAIGYVTMNSQRLEHELVVASDELRVSLSDLQKRTSEIKVLSGLLPICASCKKIRNDQGYWQQVEVYVTEHSEADFSHGICPDCMKKLYGDLLDPEESVSGVLGHSH